MRHTLLFLVLAIFVFVNVVTRVRCDCTFAKGQSIKFNNAIDCLDQVPLPKKTFEQTMDTIQRVVKLYVFRDISVSSPDEHYPSQIDVDKEMAKIRAKTYKSEYAFTKDITKVMRQFHDGHFVYSPPTCFSSFPGLQPFVMISIVDPQTKAQSIEIVALQDKMDATYTNLFGINNLKSFVNGTVVKINGVNAKDYIYKFAQDNVGSSHDVGIRFSISLARYQQTGGLIAGNFFYRSATSLQPDTDEQITYSVKLKTGEVVDISVPWVSIVQHDYTSLEDLVKDCHKTATPVPKIQANKMHQSEPVIKTEHSLKLQSTSLQAEPQLMISGDVASFWKMDDKTATLVVTSFEPNDNNVFGQTLYKGFEMMVKQGMHQIIVDVSNNGGGELCWGYALATLLLPEAMPYGSNDLLVTPLANAYANAAVKRRVSGTYWSPDYWTQMNKTTPFDFDTKWINPGHKYVRGGVEGVYSERFRDNCDYLFNNMPTPAGLKFSPSQIKLLSTGWCGSTCSVFSRHLQEYDKVTTVVVGGIYDSPMSFSTTPGGQVTTVEETVEMARALGEYGNPLSPPGFDTVNTARMTYTLREIYPWSLQNDVPLEFFFEPATEHIYYTKESSMNPKLLWNDVMKLFDKKSK